MQGDHQPPESPPTRRLAGPPCSLRSLVPPEGGRDFLRLRGLGPRGSRLRGEQKRGVASVPLSRGTAEERSDDAGGSPTTGVSTHSQARRLAGPPRSLRSLVPPEGGTVSCRQSKPQVFQQVGCLYQVAKSCQVVGHRC